MKTTLAMLFVFALSGCATTVAVVDVTASTMIYAGKTVVNVVDYITPDIIPKNK